MNYNYTVLQQQNLIKQKPHNYTNWCHQSMKTTTTSPHQLWVM